MSDENLPKIMRAVATLRADGSGSLATNGSHEDLREADTEQLRGVIAERLREAAEREGRPIHVLTTEDGDEAAIMVHPSGDIDENVPMLPPPAWLRRTTPSAEANSGENAPLPRPPESFAPNFAADAEHHDQAPAAPQGGSLDDFDWQPPAAPAEAPAAPDDRLQEPVEETTFNPWRPPHFEEASAHAPADSDPEFPEDSGPVAYGRSSGERDDKGHAEKGAVEASSAGHDDSTASEADGDMNDATIARPSSDPTPTHPTETPHDAEERGGANHHTGGVSDASTPDAVRGAAENIGIPNGAAFGAGHDPHAREFSPEPASPRVDEDTQRRPVTPLTGTSGPPGLDGDEPNSYLPQGVDGDGADGEPRTTAQEPSDGHRKPAQPAHPATAHDENAYLASTPERESGAAQRGANEQRTTGEADAGTGGAEYGVAPQTRQQSSGAPHGSAGLGAGTPFERQRDDERQGHEHRQQPFAPQPFSGGSQHNNGTQPPFEGVTGQGEGAGQFAPHPTGPNQGESQNGHHGLAQFGHQGQHPGQGQGQGQYHTPAGTPTLNSLLAERPKEKPAPAEKGFGGFVRSISGGLVTMPPGKHELQLRRWTESVQRSLNGPKTIVVVNPKGGAQKTTATLLIAATFGLARGGYTLAWDNNETRGTLGWRAAHSRHSNTAVNLLHDLDRFTEAAGSRVGDLDNYVRGQGDAQFDVLASDEDAAASSTIDAEAFNRLHQTLQRFYRVLVIDTGNNMRASNWKAAVEAADQLVIVSTVREDTAQSAAWLVDGLRERGLGEKVANGVTILGSTSKKGDPQLTERLHRHFGQLTRSVVDVPYDPALVDGSSLRMPLLSKHTREAWLHASAEIAEGL